MIQNEHQRQVEHRQGNGEDACDQGNQLGTIHG